MENTKVELSEKSKNIFALYTLDFLLCYPVVGKAGKFLVLLHTFYMAIIFESYPQVQVL